MTTTKHPRELTADEVDAIVAGSDDHDNAAYSVTDAATLSDLRLVNARWPLAHRPHTGVIAMLASADGAHMTGTEIRIDGGTHC